MAKIRFSALEELSNRKPVDVGERRRVSEIFGCDVLTVDKMRQYLSIEAFKKLEKVMSEGGVIDRGLADRKMRLNELAAQVGISNVNLSYLKTGKVKAVRFSTLDAICKVLGCQPGDILEYVEDEEE